RFRRMMGEHERCLDHRLVDAFDAQRRRRIPRLPVVIAAHQHHLDPAMAEAPLLERGERGGCPSRTRVQEIAEEEETLCTCARQHGVESLEGGGRRTDGYR